MTENYAILEMSNNRPLAGDRTRNTFSAPASAGRPQWAVRQKSDAIFYYKNAAPED